MQTHNWERNAIIQLAEALDIIIAAWLLASKLITWEAQEFNLITILLLQLLIQRLETSILGCETALRSRVDDENDFVIIVLQWNWGALFCVAKNAVSLRAYLDVIGEAIGIMFARR